MPFEFGIQEPGGSILEEDITAPLPVGSLDFDVAHHAQVIRTAAAELFYLMYGDFMGAVTDTSLVLEYLPWKHVGFGLGLDAMRIWVEAKGSDYPGVDSKGSVELDYPEAQLYVKVFL